MDINILNTKCFSVYKQQLSNIWSSVHEKVKQQSQPAITCSKLKIETLEQDVKYVQS